jgi:predicted lipoprotein with Yx(FWY)xxD motif
MKRMILGLTAALFLTGAAMTGALAADPAKTMDTTAGKVWTGVGDMTLYTFDKDTKGAMTSACTGKCIEAWPPFLAAADAKAEGDWTIVDAADKDGKPVKMWAYDGWPLYYYVKDAAPGDVTGDGVGKVWHVAKAN